MRIRVLVITLLAAIPLSAQEPQPCPNIQQPAPLRKRIDSLLSAESDSMARLQILASEIKCDYQDEDTSSGCRGLIDKLKDEARDTSAKIVQYQSSSTRPNVELFDIYVASQSILNEIELLREVDKNQGGRYVEPLSVAYNSLIKLTGVWFPGEMRNAIEAQGKS